MLRKFLDYQLSFFEEGKPLHRLRPLVAAGDTFFYEAPINTTKGPHIRDAIDIKRWMMVVVIALIPCILFGIWNTGLQSFVYGSQDAKLMQEYLTSSLSFDGYINFATKDARFLTILQLGLAAVLPIILISYAVGGLWEAIFACLRGHEISEGFLVTGILYALILPSTIPYWMVAVGVSAGVILGKEVFGGSGNNIVNPALCCRAFLFFTFPGKMTGSVWVGTNPTLIRKSLIKMNQDAHTTALDGFSQATELAKFNVNPEIKRIHVDAIATNNFGSQVDTYPIIEKSFDKWNALGDHGATLGQLTTDQMHTFVTSPLSEGGLGLSAGYYDDAYHFASLNFGLGHDNDWSFFFGDKLGCIGETSTFACLLGAIYLIYTGVGAWRTMVAMGLGAFLTALCFQFISTHFGQDSGAWNAAPFALPAYKHLLLGGLAFGMVFMATDPVSSPSMNGAKWVYGLFCGMITIVIRVINPAYPEGVMLSILMGNVFAPLFDHYASRLSRKRSTARVRTTA
jgi:Na+-transporting NADH:ubiquinone oxidoreductase subunit B